MFLDGSFVSAALEIKQLWYEYEDCTSEEARVVKDLDKLEMIVQADDYEKGELRLEAMPQPSLWVAVIQFYYVMPPVITFFFQDAVCECFGCVRCHVFPRRHRIYTSSHVHLVTLMTLVSLIKTLSHVQSGKLFSYHVYHVSNYLCRWRSTSACGFRHTE